MLLKKAKKLLLGGDLVAVTASSLNAVWATDPEALRGAQYPALPGSIYQLGGRSRSPGGRFVRIQVDVSKASIWPLCSPSFSLWYIVRWDSFWTYVRVISHVYPGAVADFGPTESF